MAVVLEAASDNGRAERKDYEHRATRSLDVQTIPTRSSIEANSLEAQICDSDSRVTSEERTDGKDKSNLSVPFHKLFYFADSCDVVLMVLGTLGAMANGAALPIMTVIFGQLINAFGQNTNNLHVLIHEVSKVAIRFVYIGGAASFASFCGVAFWMCTGERQAARIRGLYLKAILRQDVGFFDKEITTGEVIGRMSGDTILIQEAVGEKVGKFIQLVSTFLGGFSVAFFKGWKLALIMLSTMPLIVAAGGIMSVVISRMSSKGQVAYAEAGSIVEQIVGAIKTVAAFTGEKRAVDAYDKALKQAYKAGILQGMAAGLSLGCVMLVMLSSYALSLWYGSKLVVNHGYSGGAVMNVIFAVLTGGMSLGQASPSLNAFAAGQAAAYKMFEVINRIPEIDVLNMDGLILENLKGDLEIQNVNFFYPARTNFQVFSGFSLLIPSGFTTALVGESGSGKSTVISLIERFYDPQSGQILVDGIDIKHLQLKWYRRQIGLVSQEPVLFGTSIRENIAYGKAEATIEEIQAVAEMANAASFIKKLPKGYDTPVGEHGAQLSGGQKQRVAIARAILKNPRILLLDEATSALDAKSESLVQEALDRIMVNRTTVVVAHRLTTIRNAHCIAVVQHGSIVEKGSHWELMQNPSSAYCQLVRLQQTYQTKEEDNTKGEIDPDNVYIQDDGRSLSRASSRTSPSMLLFSKLSPMRQPFSRSSSKADDRQFFSLDKSSSFGSAKEHVEQREKRSGLLGFCASKDTDDPEKGQHVTRQQTSIWRIAALNKPEAPIFVLGFFSAIGNGMIFPLFGLILSSLIGSFFERNPHKLRQDANFWSCMFLVLACMAFVVTPSQIFCFSVVGHRLIRRVRRLTFDKIVRQEISWFDDYENSSGAISARLSTDAAHVRSVVGDSLSLAVQNLATVSVGLVIAFTANWQLSLLILALVPLIGLQGIMQVKFMKGFSSDVKVMYEEASRVANDAVSSIRTVASFGAESKVLKLYEERCKIPLKSGIQQGMISGTGLAFSNFLLYASYSLTFWFGSRLVGERKTEFKNVFKVFFAIVLSALGVAQSAGLAPDIAKVEAAINSVFSILDRKSTIDPYDTTGKVLKLLKGDIEYRNISFRYPTRPDVQIFQDFNLSVPAGKTLALVGESGSGKSTAISLIERFYDPDTGHIFIDGVDIKSLQIKWLRQQIGLVSQEPILFDGTIRSNIAYGRENAVSDKDIQAAAEASNAHNFIASMPDGYNTRVGERGIQLSGGQKQRIAIARAIIKNSKILLLDEATSALDAESESLVQEALDQMMTTQTTLVVAHRLSTIINASVIAVLKNGIVAEQGKHSDLIAINGGLYSSLVKLHKASST